MMANPSDRAWARTMSSRRARLGRACMFAEHGHEGIEDFAHLRTLVGKDVSRIHVVDDRGVVGFEYEKLAVARLRAIDGEIVETDARGDFAQRMAVPKRE